MILFIVGIVEMNKFDELLKQTGLSNKGAAYLLRVRHDTIKNWRYGRCKVPDGVMRDLECYASAAREIFLER